MILGRIIGKSSTTSFKFRVEDQAKKFDYVQAMHNSGSFVLAQVEEIEKEQNKTTAYARVIGHIGESGKLQGIRSPLDPGVEVLKADDDFIQVTLGLRETKDTAFIGGLDGHPNIPVHLDLNKVLTKHVSVLAKSGSGKSYTVAVLLEEILLKKIPVVVIDPHGEYSTLKYPNPKDKEAMISFNLEPKGFLNQVIEYSPDIDTNKEAKPLKLSNKNLSSGELIQLLPTKLSSAQLGLMYTAIKNLGGKVDFGELLFELETIEDNNSKWTLINIIEYLKKLNLFSNNPTLMGELVQPGKMSIINLKGVSPDVQGIVAYKLINDLFRDRKKGKIPPFFLVIEECHNFIPERSFGEAKSSAIIRQVASEGRKFGLGLCLISQRPSRVEKNALSQASTQIILKMTNPHDVRAVSNSVEGMNQNSEKSLPNIEIGTALVAGVIDIPLLVKIRPRLSKHGGEAETTFTQSIDIEEEKDFTEQTEDFSQDLEALPIIKQKFNLEDIKLMHGDNVEVVTELLPCVMINCNKKGEDFNILIDLLNLQIIDDIENVTGPSLLNLKLQELNNKEDKLLNIAVNMDNFTAADLFGKSGLQFAELHETIGSLVRKGYFTKEGNNFFLSDDMQFLARIQEKQFYQNISYAKISGKQIEAKYKYDVVKDFLSKFFDVQDLKECFMIKYSVKKELIS